MATSPVGDGGERADWLAVLSPMVSACDEGAAQAIKSQAELATQIDRAAAELERFLGGAHLPPLTAYASRLTDVRSRLASANAKILQVQTRISRVRQLALECT
uniref:Biogenesis of lysosome-related organelles complex 1 subunit 7 n=1 Tax=Coccolithus braarudii TaxID=221442 RepID=A0A7S0LD56_9EUKA|mmetsp:Transcript_34315/g.73287  ORF Transcript_34315/g.73287 Transcript_34315/m.73287 type:complete len:103 (+) Transcript_34315:4-312(+)